eukprot:3226623-Pyramimonas_sp.AAC.1
MLLAAIDRSWILSVRWRRLSCADRWYDLNQHRGGNKEAMGSRWKFVPSDSTVASSSDAAQCYDMHFAPQRRS